MKVVFRIAAALGLAAAMTTIDLAAQERRGGPPPGQQGARGRMSQGDGLTPREIQDQFDAYVIAQAENVLQINEEQYPQFVRRVRALQTARRQARIERTRLISRLNMMSRAEQFRTREGRRGAGDEAGLMAAIRALDDHERAAPGEIAKAFAALDEVLTPWQRARFRVLEEQLEQKKLDMMFRARQGPRR